MRKLVELTVVFLLGWALALYILEDRRSDNPGEGEVSVDAAHNPAITDYPSPSHQGGNAAIKKSAATEQPEQAKQLLERGDIDAFMALLQKHRVPADETLWQNYRTVFFNALQQLKNNKQYTRGIDWLTVYLQSEYDDVLALQALADFHYLQTNYLAAIDTLYLAKSYAHDTPKINQIVTTLRAFTAEYAHLLQNKDDNLGLLDLYQRLVSVEPEYSEHYVGLAQAYMALGNEADARQALSIIAYDPEARPKVHQLLNLIESRSSKPMADSEPISLTRHGNNLLTTVLFNNRSYGLLLLDTGASLTVITPQLSRELSLDLRRPLRKSWFNTANGVLEAPIYRIDRLSLGGQTVDQLDVAVMNLNNDQINGLLGMNFLQHFRFSIDQQNNILYLSPRN